MTDSGVNGTKVIKPLTELEKRILTIMTPQAVDGDKGVKEFGLPDDYYEDITYLEKDPKEGHIEGPTTTTTSQSQPSNVGNAEVRSPQEESIPAPASTSQPQVGNVSAGVRKQAKRPRRTFTADNMDKYLEIENKKMEMEREK